MLADITAIPVERPTVTETTALGAAYLAGLQHGIWPSLDELQSHWHLEKQFKPAMPAAEREKMITGWRDAVARVLGRES
jgi:glycerol kinase